MPARKSDKPGAVGILDGFTLDEMRNIPILESGVRLARGATYLDLCDPERVPFTATGGEVVGARSWIVPKADVPHEYWNRLLRSNRGA
jgi:hypothetical protein